MRQRLYGENVENVSKIDATILYRSKDAHDGAW